MAPHLRTLSKYLGAGTVYEIAAEYQEFGDERHRMSVANAKNQAESIAFELSVSNLALSSKNEIGNV